MTENTVKREIARNVFRWLRDYGSDLLRQGLGDLDPATDELGPGMLDELPMDSPAYIYVAQMIQYIRFVLSILDEE
jgi:hypothetical protein